ncbi:hypothetical protein FOA43_004653 [Brettanomyces nanus]|uniref:RRN7-type domain-containing protein n=1 Tax=Eeniella nana TaxID=13502 RepID=A0A875S7B5_EENNA|nr:uncharacterized protein FOA43_004653 [Brettanomyces nanus]QPG77246.1 hypothetical protein FOA43_004653 [Brettanomyces nanus]
MSTVGYRRGPVCGVDNCPSKLWRLIDGRNVCQYGHVNEDAIELNDEDENIASAASQGFTRRLNNVSGLTKSQARHKRVEMLKLGQTNSLLYGKQLNLMLVRAMQVILCKQIKCLAEHYNIQGDTFVKVAKRYWCLLLAHMYHGKKSPGEKMSLVFNDLFMVCYLALLQVNAPVYMMDLLNLATLERIPFMKAENSVPPSISRRIPLTSFPLLKGSLISKRSYYNLKGWNRILDSPVTLTNYKLNYLPLLVRLVLKLYLPLEIVTLVKNIIVVLDVKLTLQPGELHPELKLVGLIIVMTKLYFHSSAKTRYNNWVALYYADISKLDTDLDPARVEAKLQNHSSPEELVQWDSDEIEQAAKLFYRYYLPPIRNENIANHKKHSTTKKVIVQRLNAIFPIEELEGNEPERALESYKTHLADIYSKLYEDRALNIDDANCHPYEHLIDLLVDGFKMDTGLTLEDFKDIVRYGDNTLKEYHRTLTNN